MTDAGQKGGTGAGDVRRASPARPSLPSSPPSSSRRGGGGSVQVRSEERFEEGPPFEGIVLGKNDRGCGKG
jgi:hypothetical protein